MNICEFTQFNSRTLRLKFNKAFFDNLNFKLDTKLKNEIISLCVIELKKLDEKTVVTTGLLRKVAEDVFSNYLKNNITDYSFVCRFISCNFEDTDNYYVSLISLAKFAIFAESCGVHLSEKYLSQIVKQNEVLKKNLFLIVDAKKDAFFNEKIDKVIKNDFMLLLLNIFLFLYPFDKQDSFRKGNDADIALEPLSKDKLVLNKNDIPLISINFNTLPSCTDLKAYTSAISNIPILTFEQEQELGRRIMTGDMKAREQLVCFNLKLSLNIAKKYVGHGLELSDLIQEGNLGLITAADKFDYRRGNKFSTLASWWVKHTINRAIDDKSRTVRIPAYKNAEVNKLRKVYRELVSKYDREPTNEELADFLDISLEDVKYLVSLMSDTISLNSYVDDDEKTEFLDFLSSDDISPLDSAYNKQRSEEILKLIESENLNLLEKQVLLRHLGFNGTEESFAEIGRSVNLSRQRISIVFNNAINKIVRGKNLEKYRNFSTAKIYEKKK